MRRLFVMLCIALAPCGIAAAQMMPKGAEQGSDCKGCHTCERPTAENRCLLACPRHEMLVVHHPVGESPEVVTLGELSARYVPVVFAHRQHASMSEFGRGCTVCHHHRAEGRITGCKACHPLSPETADLEKPSLKGAYHRQCLSCHREWSHTTKCEVCHALKNEADKHEVAEDRTDIVDVEHPPIEEPTRVVYETDPDVGMYVTFYHDDHVEHFRLSCASCHREENCDRCHHAAAREPVPAPAPRARQERDFDAAHRECLACHNDHSCDKCHQETQRDPFDHEVTAGWPLGRYHHGVPCRECHGDAIRMGKVSGVCNECHADWRLGNFDHRVAGLALDDDHAEMDCEVCHEDRDYTKKPGCGACHDDKMYPEHRPGTLVRSRSAR